MTGVSFGPATNGSTKLSDFYNDEVLPLLTPELVYDWPGHNWHRSPGKWRGACPHHTSESGTSFNVSLDSLTWFCPACDIGGGPVQYRYWLQGGTGSPRGREFVEILGGLAERVGLTLPEWELTDDERAAAEAAATKRGALELVYHVAQDHLWSDAGASARAYLHGRGIDDDGIRALELGLYPTLGQIGAALETAGYGPFVEHGAWWKLVGYVTFPWRDDHGQPLTLYGRWPGSSGWPDGCEKTMALPGEGSKASPLYFDRLRRAHHDDATLVEGLLDAAVAQANGLTNVIAYVGAQPSHAQHRVMARHRIRAATICSDPDKGGEGGILSFLRNVDPSIRAYVAPMLPDGMDPDQFILARGVDGWREHVARAEPGHIWRTRYILGRHDLASPKGRDDARVELVEYARTARDHEWDDMTTVAAEPLEMDAGTLRRYLSGDDRRNGHATTPASERPSQGQQAATASLQEILDGLSRSGSVPEIDAGVLDLRVITAQAWDAIKRANRERPFIFKHGGLPVWVARDDDGRAMLGELTLTHIRHILARVAEFYIVKVKKVTQPDGGELQTKVRYVVLPPSHLCADVLATPEPDLPVVARLTESPVFGPDGTLHSTPGYHAASRTYLAIPPGLTIPAIPDAPSSDDIARARVLIVDDLLGDFPFASASEMANVIGLGLEPFVRAMIDGPVPLHSVEAPTPGSGKGLLVDATLRPACGRTVGAISQAKDEDEWRKRITSSLVQGYPAIQIDNATKSIDSGALSMALTIPVWTDRILGQTRMVSVPVRCSWVVTANNPTYSTEMARRTVRTRIDPKCDRPQDRDGWRHPELLAWVDDNRGDLIWAFCTLVRAWIVAGRPPFSGKALGSFERWSHVIGGILEHTGIPGFLGNQATFYDVADAETAMWRAFVLAWWERFQDQEVGSADLFPLAVEMEGFDLGDGQEGSKSQRTRFGKMLGAQRDRVIGDYRVTAPRTVQRAQRWQLVSTEDVNVVNMSERFDTQPHTHTRETEVEPGAETFTNVHNVHTNACKGCGDAGMPGPGLYCVECLEAVR